MDNIPTKKEIATKEKEVNALWTKAIETRRIAATAERDLKEMRWRRYLAKTLAIDAGE